ncbi:hypothetical protein MTCD1_03427 [Colwellia marinimaniae]|uniref:Uncharacterized protein n=1 Tax=Colwellia marinimaniae TaxID=1513592 RepID=A0ABQ0MZR0_9GAMM|nr:hypothetical protein MTCD1_03427 [Colwellia marinimaniae]
MYLTTAEDRFYNSHANSSIVYACVHASIHALK